jgi:hypothetical protein
MVMRTALFVSLSSLLAACNGYDPDLGGAPFLCGSQDPKCPDGYTCQDDGTGRQVCIGGSGKIVDSGTSGFQCADDSILEGASKNDTIPNAYATPVATQRNDISFAGLAICPEGDKDTYKIDLQTVSDLEVTTSWESGMPVSVSILGGGGATLVNGTSSGANTLKAFAANLAPGSGPYYAQAYAAATVKNNYKITIKVTPH